jgi:hypothetical protein
MVTVVVAAHQRSKPKRRRRRSNQMAASPARSHQMAASPALVRVKPRPTQTTARLKNPRGVALSPLSNTRSRGYLMPDASLNEANPR